LSALLRASSNAERAWVYAPEELALVPAAAADGALGVGNGVDDLAHYPLFTADLLDSMRRLLPPARREAVGVAVVVSARA
jgi:hypothetical protein